MTGLNLAFEYRPTRRYISLMWWHRLLHIHSSEGPQFWFADPLPLPAQAALSLWKSVTKKLMVNISWEKWGDFWEKLIPINRKKKFATPLITLPKFSK